jgi:phosphomevalonate kinase
MSSDIYFSVGQGYGKILISGGYLILDPSNSGLCLTLPWGINCQAKLVKDQQSDYRQCANGIMVRVISRQFEPTVIDRWFLLSRSNPSEFEVFDMR